MSSRKEYRGVRYGGYSYSIRHFYSDDDFDARRSLPVEGTKLLVERIAAKLASRNYKNKRAKRHLQAVLGSALKEISKRDARVCCVDNCCWRGEAVEPKGAHPARGHLVKGVDDVRWVAWDERGVPRDPA